MDFHCAISILQKTVRSDEEILSLAQELSQVQFFANLKDEQGTNVLHECCSTMLAEIYDRNDVVFEFGDEGTTFCVILDGVVGVQVPQTVTDEEGEERTEFLEVATLRTGQAFGELSLLKGQPRAATITCKERTILAVLEKRDYHKILGKRDLEKLKVKVSFLRSLEFFRDWSTKPLTQVSLFFKEERFEKGQTVFSEGTRADNVYFIREGEFLLTKRFRHHGKVPSKRSLQISTKSAGQILLSTEALNHAVVKTTCRCVSKVGHVLSITSDNFQRKVYHSFTKDTIDRKSKTNDSWISHRVARAKSAERSKLEISTRRSIERSGNSMHKVYSNIHDKSLFLQIGSPRGLLKAFRSIPTGFSKNPSDDLGIRFGISTAKSVRSVRGSMRGDLSMTNASIFNSTMDRLVSPRS